MYPMFRRHRQDTTVTTTDTNAPIPTVQHERGGAYLDRAVAAQDACLILNVLDDGREWFASDVVELATWLHDGSLVASPGGPSVAVDDEGLPEGAQVWCRGPVGISAFEDDAARAAAMDRLLALILEEHTAPTDAEVEPLPDGPDEVDDDEDLARLLQTPWNGMVYSDEGPRPGPNNLPRCDVHEWSYTDPWDAFSGTALTDEAEWYLAAERHYQWLRHLQLKHPELDHAAARAAAYRELNDAERAWKAAGSVQPQGFSAA